MSYADVEAFLAKLNERDRQAGWEYRLPTSDEWEHACRGGPLSDRAESAFHFYIDKPSNELPPDKANYAHAGGPNRTVKVGLHPPNKLGLCDMHAKYADVIGSQEALDYLKRLPRGMFDLPSGDAGPAHAGA